MAAQVCTSCTTTFSVGAPRCPHCGGRKWLEDGSPAHAKWVAVQGVPELELSDPDGEETTDA